MTQKQAIHCLKVNIDEAICEECELYGEVGCDHCSSECNRLAIEALEKQIPRTAINIKCFTLRTKIGYCPSCGCGTNSDIIFCDKCGQKLNWRS